MSKTIQKLIGKGETRETVDRLRADVAASLETVKKLLELAKVHRKAGPLVETRPSSSRRRKNRS